MRADQLARQWGIIWAIEASPNWSTVAEIAKREETGTRAIYRGMEALQATRFRLCMEKADRTNRWAFLLGDVVENLHFTFLHYFASVPSGSDQVKS